MKYIREKGKWSNGETKYVIEENKKYLKTLPKVEELYSLLCLDKVSYFDREKENKSEIKSLESSYNLKLSEQPKQDIIQGEGRLIPSVIDENARADTGVKWTCDVCGYSTRLTWEGDKSCIKCKERKKLQAEINRLGVV